MLWFEKKKEKKMLGEEINLLVEMRCVIFLGIKFMLTKLCYIKIGF